MRAWVSSVIVISFWRRVGDSILGNGSGQLQRMEFAPHPPAERGIDRALLRDARLTPGNLRSDYRFGAFVHFGWFKQVWLTGKGFGE